MKVEIIEDGEDDVCRKGLMKIDENGRFRWKKWWRLLQSVREDKLYRGNEDGEKV